MGTVRDRSTRAKGAIERKAKPASNDVPEIPRKSPGRPRKLKPPPPIFDCRRCSKLAELQRRVRELEQAEEARAAAALADVPVCLSDAQVEEAISSAKSRMAGALDEIAKRQVDIATSPGSHDADATRAGAWIYDRVAGPVTQRLEHSAPGGAPLCTPTMLEVIVVGSASVAASPEPEPDKVSP